MSSRRTQSISQRNGFSLLLARAFRGQRHQMALHGTADRRDGIGDRFAIQQPDEILDHPRVAALVPGEIIGQQADVDHLFLAAKGLYHNPLAMDVPQDFAHGAHDPQLAASIRGEGAHGKADGRSPFKQQVDHLMIHNVVVTAIDTPAVGTSLQALQDVLFRRLVLQHIDWPPQSPRFTLSR